MPHLSSPPYWDNAASFSIVNNRALLYNVKPLPQPIPVDGISGPTPLTHSGNLHCLPSTNNMNYALFGPKLTNNLFSLGFVQSKGGEYHTLDTNSISIRADPHPAAKPQIVQRSSNNLLPVDLTSLYRQYTQSKPSSLFLSHSILPSTPTPTNADPSQTLPLPPGITSTSPIAQSSLTDSITRTTLHNTLAPPRLNAEQIKRADLVHALHLAMSCMPDAALIENLRLGKFDAPWGHLTAADVRNNRLRRPVCPSCAAGRITAPPAITSTSPPATRPGEQISWDPQVLSHPVVGGYTHKNTILDEHANFVMVPGAISKNAQHLYNSLATAISKLNSHGHRVDNAFADPEACNIALGNQLRAIGINTAVAIPTHFARAVERVRRTINEKARSTLDSLPYHLPPKYNLILDQHIAANMNRTVNERSYPLTPEEAVCGKRSTIPLAFGTSAMVRTPLGKRVEGAKLSNQEVKLEPKAEVGVSLGTCPYTGATQFVLANGSIVPRHYDSSRVFPRSFIPFNWNKKIYVPNTDPPIPPELPSAPLQVQRPTNTTVQTTTATTSNQAHAITSRSKPQQNPTLLTELRLRASHHRTQQNKSSITNTLPPLQPTPNRPSLSPQLTITHTTSLPLAQTTVPTTPVPHPHSLIPITSQPNTTTRSSSRTQHTPGLYRSLHTRGLLSSTMPLKHYDRKLILTKAAVLRDRNYRTTLHSLLPLQKFNNLPNPTRPTPAKLQHTVHSLTSACKHLPMHHLQIGMNRELTKVFKTYGAMKLITQDDLEPKKAFLPSLFAIKPKPTLTAPDDIRVRLAINGARQPGDSFSHTHAGTSDQPHRSAALAFTLADVAHRGVREKLQVINFDLPSAFINNNPLPRSATGGYQLFTRLPISPILPPEYSGQLAELTGAMNGIKQANHIFDQDLRDLYIANGYNPCPSSEYTFRKTSPTDQHDYLIVSMGVDDGEIITTSPTLLAEFQSMITTRYGPVDFITSRGMCGTRYTFHNDGSLSVDYGPYIRRVLDRVGMAHIEPTLTPSLANFFDPPTDTTPATQAEHKSFQQINGELIFILPARHDVRMEIVALCKRNSAPTVSDISKQHQVLRYLSGCPDIGITFSADPQDHPNGVEVGSTSDSAHNTDPTTGASQNAYTLTCGRPGAITSPFLAHSASDSTGGSLPLSPMEAEYTTLSMTAKQLVHYRQFAEDLGFPQTRPSVMLEDNDSAIKLANSPQIPARSRHINLRFHHIRREIQRKIIETRHQGTNDIASDGMTKVTSPSRFLYNRSILFPKIIEQLRNSPPYFKLIK